MKLTIKSNENVNLDDGYAQDERLDFYKVDLIKKGG